MSSAAPSPLKKSGVSVQAPSGNENARAALKWPTPDDDDPERRADDADPEKRRQPSNGRDAPVEQQHRERGRAHREEGPARDREFDRDRSDARQRQRRAACATSVSRSAGQR